MSLCYDFQKWTMLTLSSIAISMIVGLVLIQYAHGITEEERQANREKYARLIEEDIKKQDNGTTGCVDHNLCGVPSPEFERGAGVVPAPEPEPEPQTTSNNPAMCMAAGGQYYILDGESHCLIK